MTRLTAICGQIEVTSSSLQGLSALSQLRCLFLDQLKLVNDTGQLCTASLFHSTALTRLGDVVIPTEVLSDTSNALHACTRFHCQWVLWTKSEHASWPYRCRCCMLLVWMPRQTFMTRLRTLLSRYIMSIAVPSCHTDHISLQSARHGIKWRHMIAVAPSIISGPVTDVGRVSVCTQAHPTTSASKAEAKSAEIAAIRQQRIRLSKIADKVLSVCLTAESRSTANAAPLFAQVPYSGTCRDFASTCALGLDALMLQFVGSGAVRRVLGNCGAGAEGSTGGQQGGQTTCCLARRTPEGQHSLQSHLHTLRQCCGTPQASVACCSSIRTIITGFADAGFCVAVADAAGDTARQAEQAECNAGNRQPVTSSMPMVQALRLCPVHHLPCSALHTISGPHASMWRSAIGRNLNSQAQP